MGNKDPSLCALLDESSAVGGGGNGSRRRLPFEGNLSRAMNTTGSQGCKKVAIRKWTQIDDG